MFLRTNIIRLASSWPFFIIICLPFASFYVSMDVLSMNSFTAIIMVILLILIGKCVSFFIFTDLKFIHSLFHSLEFWDHAFILRGLKLILIDFFFILIRKIIWFFMFRLCHLILIMINILFVKIRVHFLVWLIITKLLKLTSSKCLHTKSLRYFLFIILIFII